MSEITKNCLCWHIPSGKGVTALRFIAAGEYVTIDCGPMKGFDLLAKEDHWVVDTEVPEMQTIYYQDTLDIQYQNEVNTFLAPARNLRKIGNQPSANNTERECNDEKICCA